MISDPVADVLTKIRNASRRRLPVVEVVASKLTTQVLEALKREGYIRAYKPTGQPPKRTIRIYLKYAQGRTPAIAKLIRVSKPGRRRYARVARFPRVLGGLGRAILTTSKGVLTDQEARRENIGGEVLCYVW